VSLLYLFSPNISLQLWEFHYVYVCINALNSVAFDFYVYMVTEMYTLLVLLFIGSGVSAPQVAENRYLPLTGGIALTTVYALTCYTVIWVRNIVM